MILGGRDFEMKKRLFALIVVLGFFVIFIANKNVLVLDDQHAEQLIPVETSSVKAAPIIEHGPLEGMNIVLDAGHGGFDSGAVGQHETLEKDVALTTVRLLRDLLESEGATVQLTRDEDTYVSLTSRVTIGSMHRAHLFLSIHADGFENSEAKGMTTYYYDEQSEPVATTIHNSIFKKKIETENRGIEFGNYQVLRDSFVPAVLLELGYITNKEDEALLNSPGFQEKVSRRIVEGVIGYAETYEIISDTKTNIVGENFIAH